METPANTYNMCFGCSQANPIGLKLKFTMDGEVCRSSFTAEPQYQGWAGYIHGGILSTLLDEVMAQWIWQKNIPAMTAEITVRFSKAVPVNVPLTLESRCVGSKGKLHLMEGRIILPDGSVPCSATAKFLTLTQKNSPLNLPATEEKK